MHKIVNENQVNDDLRARAVGVMPDGRVLLWVDPEPDYSPLWLAFSVLVIGSAIVLCGWLTLLSQRP